MQAGLIEPLIGPRKLFSHHIFGFTPQSMHLQKSVKAFDVRNRSLFCLRPAEAGILAARGYATWRGKKQDAITVSLTKHQLIAWIGDRRYKSPPDATAIDSRTHCYEGGAAKYGHRRNEMYSANARTWQ
jgi:hypothetical protein